MPPKPNEEHNKKNPNTQQRSHDQAQKRQSYHQRQNQNQSHSQNPNQHRRRKAFGSELTHQPQASLTTTQAQSNNPLTSLNSLSQRLIQELSTCSYDCAICITPIKPHQPIYHCAKCFAVFHLNCSSKWASRSVTDSSQKAILLRDRDHLQPSPDSIRGEWRCPGCQHSHVGTESIPKNYTCWCQKVLNLNNPSDNNNLYSHPHRHAHRRASKIPHGCGQRCNKASAHGCVHGCTEICHPGPCPPCAAVIKTKCHCQKTQLSIRCSQLYSTRTSVTNPSSGVEAMNYSSELSCDQVCNKTLSCGIHSCQKTCHPGPCPECQVIRDKSCYCASLKLIDQRCSNRIEFVDPMLTVQAQKNQDGKLVCVSSDGRSEWVGEFRCQARCEWKYHCGIHTCTSTCHPHQDIKPLQCPYSPELTSSCPCGSTPLEESSRKSCSDPIPTCQNPCGKPLEPCGHACPSKCHLGPCPEALCKASVTTVCRCGKDKIIRSCKEIEQLKKDSLIKNALIQDANEREDETLVTTKAIEYTCDRKCRVLRSCGKHACNRACCPLSFLETYLYQKKSANKNQSSQSIPQDDPLGLHTCHLVCNKKLSCGTHSCELQDHKGPCPPCLLASFDPLICHCGLTMIEPPIRCGTRIRCQHMCKRGRPDSDCGHPIIPHQCHEEPECAPCVYLTSKPCQCSKKNLVKNVRCSQPTNKISCAQRCNDLLACGAHRCQLICHPIGLCQPCDQVCLKPRKHCGHGCREKCHAPSVCQTEKECPEMIEIKCKCGHSTSKVMCSSCDDKPEGNREQILECNNECELNQRNLVLIEALQIHNNKPTGPTVNPSPSNLAIEYSQNLIKFYRSHTGFAKTVESQLDHFLSCGLGPNLPTTLTISACSKLKQNFLIELIGHYRIKFQPPLGQEPKYNVKLIRDTNSSKPTKLLSEVYQDQETKNIISKEETEEISYRSRNNNNGKHVIDEKHLKSFNRFNDPSSNRFNLLSSSFSNTNTTNYNDQVDHQLTSAWFKPGPEQNSGSGRIISGGFNKPPIAVVAPVASTSNSTLFNDPHDHLNDSDVVDHWEDDA